MNYRRYYIPDATVFIVGVTKDRTLYFSNEENIELFHTMLRRTSAEYPFELPALVILPDHFHLTMKPINCTFSEVMLSFKKRFTDNFKKRNGIMTNFNFWQGRFWDHVIRNDKDFKIHLDYIHYNPVKHGYVTKPETWRHSTYLEWVEKGAYEIGWGHKEIEDLEKLNFE
jgi:putative transposase